MSRYTSFSDFMTDVVTTANQTQDLNELFDVKNEEVVDIIKKIIRKGWWVFVALATLLSLSAPVFGVSLIAFLANPAGLIIAATLGVGAAVSIRVLYRNKKLPLAIRSVGSEYKPRYERIAGSSNDNTAKNREIHQLLEEAVISLISKAKSLSAQERQELEEVLEKKILFWKS